MMRLNRLNLSIVIAMVALANAAANPKPPPLDKGVPSSYALPKGFKAPDKKSKDGEAFGFTKSKGISLEKHEGTVPFYVCQASKKSFPNGTLKIGDIILAVNGKLLGAEGSKQIKAAVKEGKKGNGIWLTRWRPGKKRGQGTIERCYLPLLDGSTIFDLTKRPIPGPTRDWRLGPLGANGWCFTVSTRYGASAQARQILITAIDKEGPSAEKLVLKDVIIGVNGKLFAADARKVLAAAINEAEKEENKGQLKLKVWRQAETGKGEEIDITITLPVLGTYSDTAPFDCPKTEKIVENGVAYMKANADTLLKAGEGGWINYVNGLGLLATGREDVMPLVKKLAHDSLLKDGEKLSVEQHVSMVCWWWSYKTIFLCEYYLRTKDEAVLPTIEELATKISLGQSGAGTWGHTYAARSNTGYYHGHLGGYGAINQQGLTLMVGLPLAVKCGVKNKEVMDAIKRGDNFFKFFIGKGTIPYGDHGPHSHWYDDNGKSGSAAVYFDIVGNREGASFFSEMVLASSPGGREAGHTGHFWSHLWGGIGAARAGDKGLQTFMKEMNPVFTLERQPNGRFAFQDNAGGVGPIGDPKEKWDCTGARLLQLCVPRRVLYVTGKETPKDTNLTPGRIERILTAGRLHVNEKSRAKMTLDEILELLKDPLPPTRDMAAKAIAERKINCVDTLVAMLDSDDKYARYGAVTALGKAGFGDKAAADKVTALLQTSTDLNFQTYAINALTNRNKKIKTEGLLKAAKPAVPVLMNMALKYSADDPRKVLQNAIGSALFYNGGAQAKRGLFPEHGLDETHRPLLVPVIKEVLTNENGGVRSTMAKWIYPQLTPAERDQLWPDIYKAVNFIAPSGIMFAPSVRTEGLKLMSKHHIKEGLDLAVWYARYQKFHASSRRMPIVLEAIEGYGAYAKRVIPELRKHAVYYDNHEKVSVRQSAAMIRATIKKIEAMPEEPEFKLVSIAGQLKAAGVECPPKPIFIQADK